MLELGVLFGVGLVLGWVAWPAFPNLAPKVRPFPKRLRFAMGIGFLFLLIILFRYFLGLAADHGEARPLSLFGGFLFGSIISSYWEPHRLLMIVRKLRKR